MNQCVRALKRTSIPEDPKAGSDALSELGWSYLDKSRESFPQGGFLWTSFPPQNPCQVTVIDVTRIYKYTEPLWTGSEYIPSDPRDSRGPLIS